MELSDFAGPALGASLFVFGAVGFEIADRLSILRKAKAPLSLRTYRAACQLSEAKSAYCGTLTYLRFSMFDAIPQELHIAWGESISRVPPAPRPESTWGYVFRSKKWRKSHFDAFLASPPVGVYLQNRYDQSKHG